MNDNHNPHFEKSAIAHKAALAAEKRFDAEPTAENAFEAYRLSREAMKTGGSPFEEQSCTFRVGNKTYNVRKEFMASTPKGHAGPDLVMSNNVRNSSLESIVPSLTSCAT